MGSFYSKIETLIAKTMFFLAILFLSIAAVIIQYMQTEAIFAKLPYTLQMIDILLKLWVIFFLERILYIIFCGHITWKNYVNSALMLIFPPLRLAARRCHHKRFIWFLGWQPVSKQSYEALEKKFLLPILFISLFMIPFWITEIFFPQRISSHDVLYHLINLGNAIIWGLFVAEFIVMMSIAEKRREYIIKHWLELFIIILPMLALARFILVARYIQLLERVRWLKFAKVQRILNIYRARSVLHRLLRMLIIIDIIKRFYQRKNPEKYLNMLQEKLQEKEQEVETLKQQIKETTELIKRNKT